MISNEQDSHETRRGYVAHPGLNILHSEKIRADRKTFFLDLIENERGRMVRVTEDVNGHRDRIMIPEMALREFAEKMTLMAAAAAQ